MSSLSRDPWNTSEAGWHMLLHTSYMMILSTEGMSPVASAYHLAHHARLLWGSTRNHSWSTIQTQHVLDSSSSLTQLPANHLPQIHVPTSQLGALSVPKGLSQCGSIIWWPTTPRNTHCHNLQLSFRYQISSWKGWRWSGIASRRKPELKLGERGQGWTSQRLTAPGFPFSTSQVISYIYSTHNYPPGLWI